MRRLIVGCGYLGKRVALRWLALGDEVFAVTRSNQRAAEFRSVGIQPIVADVTDVESLRHLPAVDTVLHAVGYDRTAAPSKRAVYVDGLRNLLNAVFDRCDRFIHVSSTSVYAQQSGEIVTESSPCEPVDESGCICLDAERLVQEFGQRAERTSFNILRLAGIYGPDRLLSRVDAICRGALLPGPPDAWLNLIHVDDAAEAIVTCAVRGEPSAIYLVSDDQPIQRSDYYRLLARLLSAPEPQFDATAVARHSRGLNKRCDNRKLREQLGVMLRYPAIREGLPQALGSAGSATVHGSG